MSGHSKWSKVKHKKAIEDQKRGRIFSKLSRQISLASRKGGPNPEMNPKLRMAIERAKSFAMPKDNIERAIKRGAGEIEGSKLEEVVFEAYGPGNIAIIIEGITDNKNRALSEIKQILSQNGGKLAGAGSVRWMFERKGCITIDLKSQMSNVKSGKSQMSNVKSDELELRAIEAGAEDIFWHNDVLDIYTKIENLERVKKNLEEKGFKIESSSLDWVAKEQIKISEKEKKACQKLFEALDESDSVQEIYSNLATRD